MPEIQRIHSLKPSTPEGPNYFFDDICDAEKALRDLYTVTKIHWYKQNAASNKAEHEFLIAEVTRRIDSLCSEKVYLVVERSPSSDAGIKRVVQTSVKTSHPIFAWDKMHCVDDPTRTALLTDRSIDHPLGSYPLYNFPILEFLRMVHVISHHSPEYQLNGAMCYWYAAMIAGLARIHFAPNGDLRRPTGAGTFKGFNAFRQSDWEADFAVINEKYIEAKRIDPDPVGPRRLQQLEREAVLKQETANAKEEAARERALKEEERALKEAAQDEVRSLRAQLRRAGATGTQLDFG
jgi:hypothetical protein